MCRCNCVHVPAVCVYATKGGRSLSAILLNKSENVFVFILLKNDGFQDKPVILHFTGFLSDLYSCTQHLPDLTSHHALV